MHYSGTKTAYSSLCSLKNHGTTLGTRTREIFSNTLHPVKYKIRLGRMNNIERLDLDRILIKNDFNNSEINIHY